MKSEKWNNKKYYPRSRAETGKTCGFIPGTP